MRRISTLLTGALILGMTSPAARACSVCFGDPDSDLSKGMSMGILTLLLIITSVLAGVATFFVFLARRSSQMPAEHTLLSSKNPLNS